LSSLADKYRIKKELPFAEVGDTFDVEFIEGVFMAVRSTIDLTETQQRFLIDLIGNDEWVELLSETPKDNKHALMLLVNKVNSQKISKDEFISTVVYMFQENLFKNVNMKVGCKCIGMDCVNWHYQDELNAKKVLKMFGLEIK